MKTAILTLILILSSAGLAAAQAAETMTLRPGEQKSEARSGMKIKFVSVIEDSRCPVNVKCVTAGNAKVQVRVWTSRGRSELHVFNSTIGPKGDQFDGYAVYLDRLTPERDTRNRGPLRYTATFAVTKLFR
jgi:hypothetical protein